MPKRNGPADKGEAGVQLPREHRLYTATVALEQHSSAVLP
jgi:hypothetical protein